MTNLAVIDLYRALCGFSGLSSVSRGDHRSDERRVERTAINKFLKCFLSTLVFLTGCATMSAEQGPPSARSGSSSASGEDLWFRLDPGWRIGNLAEVPAQNYLIMEWVRAGDDIKNWRELFTVQRFAKSWGGRSPEDALNSLKAIREKTCPSSTEWSVINKDENSILYEWRASPCLGWPDQHEISRIIDGQHARFRAGYTAKVGHISPEKRAEWINRISEFRVELSADPSFASRQRALSGTSEERGEQRITKETHLGRIHPSWIKGSVKVSGDSRRVAYVASVGDKQFVMVDGNEERRYDRVLTGSLTFSPDDRRFAYAARVGDRTFVVLDGKEDKHYEGVAADSLTFSPDGQRLGYVAAVGNKQVVVVDGTEGKQYDRVSSKPGIVFSPDGRKVAYVVKVNKNLAVVIDGEERRYDVAADVAFSPDSRRFAYAARVGDRKFVVVDGREEKAHAGVNGSLTFSPDSRRVAYAAELNGRRQLVIVDGKEEREYDNIGGGPFFSPDSKRVAYVAKMRTKWVVVVDGKEEKQYDGIQVGSAIFTPDSQRVAYVGYVGDKKIVVVDGKEGKQYDGIEAGTPIFSPDSKRVAYGALLRGRWFVVVDAKEEGHYDGGVTFSPDSKRLAHGAKVDRHWFVVVDGMEGKRYDASVPGGKIIFDSPGSLHYLAVKGGEIILVEERFK